VIEQQITDSKDESSRTMVLLPIPFSVSAASAAQQDVLSAVNIMPYQFFTQPARFSRRKNNENRQTYPF
jgi:hypothetical protein